MDGEKLELEELVCRYVEGKKQQKWMLNYLKRNGANNLQEMMKLPMQTLMCGNGIGPKRYYQMSRILGHAIWEALMTYPSCKLRGYTCDEIANSLRIVFGEGRSK